MVKGIYKAAFTMQSGLKECLSSVHVFVNLSDFACSFPLQHVSYLDSYITVETNTKQWIIYACYYFVNQKC